jgi:hypothetical protein
MSSPRSRTSERLCWTALVIAVLTLFLMVYFFD